MTVAQHGGDERSTWLPLVWTTGVGGKFARSQANIQKRHPTYENHTELGTHLDSNEELTGTHLDSNEELTGTHLDSNEELTGT